MITNTQYLPWRNAPLFALLISSVLWVCTLLLCSRSAIFAKTVQPYSLWTAPQQPHIADLSASSRVFKLGSFVPDEHCRHSNTSLVQALCQAARLLHLTLSPAPAIGGNTKPSGASIAAAFRAALARTHADSDTQLCDYLKHDVGSPREQNIVVAGLLANAESLMPHYILQLLYFAAAKPTGTLFVSIFESGSSDQTGPWLEVLAELLSMLQVPHVVRTGGTVRQPHEERIPFLARLRNIVLEPVWILYNGSSRSVHEPNSNHTHNGRAGNTSSASSTHRDCSGGSSSSSSNCSQSHDSKHNNYFGTNSRSSRQFIPEPDYHFKADKVVFLNDVFFCAQHIHRLLAQPEANLACGLDYYQIDNARRIPATWRQGIWGLQPLFLRFYDTWVARDAEGAMFSRAFGSEVTDAYGTHRLHQGLAFPVTCCWNGLAVFDAEPLYQSGLKFRHANEGECPASECSHFCEDLRRLGYDKMVVDPAVRVGYDYEVALALDRGKWQTFVPWSEAKQHKPDWQSVPSKPDMMCCPEPRPKTCYKRKIYGNHT